MREAKILPNRSEETPQNPLTFPKKVWIEFKKFHINLCQSYSTNTLWCRSYDRYENIDETFTEFSYFENRQKIDSVIAKF